MALLAISDLHIAFAANRRALEELPGHPEDWLLVAGDVGESVAHLALALDHLVSRFRQVVWTPGNHELWSRREEPGLRGVAKYHALIDACRQRGVLTPEDPYPLYVGESTLRIAPVFALYDYSFTPQPMSTEHALQWAIDQGVLCGDEAVLHPDPYPSRAAWCAARCDETETRLAEARAQDPHPLVLMGHFPFRYEHVELPAIPAFSIWCGTQRTRDWPSRFGARVVVYGHLHMPGTRIEGGIRFEEVSFGYPGQSGSSPPLASRLRLIAR